jgi:hypothetical protein
MSLVSAVFCVSHTAISRLVCVAVYIARFGVDSKGEDQL